MFHGEMKSCKCNQNLPVWQTSKKPVVVQFHFKVSSRSLWAVSLNPLRLMAFKYLEIAKSTEEIHAKRTQREIQIETLQKK